MNDVQVYSGKKPIMTKKQLTIVVVVVLVVAVAAGVGARLFTDWLQNGGADKTQTVPKEVTEAQSLVFNGDFDKAHETVNNALKNPALSVQSKYDLLIQQAYIYEGQRDPGAAMDAYLQAEAVMQTMDVAQSIARLAADKGDKELAISYYQKALARIPADNAMRVEHKKYFESAISVLQGGEPKYD